jgi:hypothetical protein
LTQTAQRDHPNPMDKKATWAFGSQQSLLSGMSGSRGSIFSNTSQS